MSNVVKFLIVALVLQIGVTALGTLNSGQDPNAAESLLALSSAKLDDADTIIIADNALSQATFQKKDGKWVLPELADFPADQTRLVKMVEKLLSSDRGYPVGSTALAAKQFKLSEDDFEKKLELKNGENVVETVFLGSSPGARKVYAKTASADKSYAISFESYQANPQATDWIDKTFLRVNQDELSSVKLKDIELTKSDNSFKAAGGEELDAEKLNDFLRVVSNIVLTRVVKDPASEKLGKELLRLERRRGEENLDLSFYPKDGEENIILVKRSDTPHLTQISKTTYEAIEKFELASLLKTAEVTEQATEEVEASTDAEDSEKKMEESA